MGSDDVYIRGGKHGDLVYVVAIENCARVGQDRAAVVHVPGGLVIALADGAGGTGNGAKAAEAVIAAVQGSPSLDPTTLLLELDDPARLGHGETTAVIAAVHGGAVSGASLGDSAAWIIAGDAILDLTGSQQRKPLLGSGSAPVEFGNAFPAGSTLLVASDGLFRYAAPHDITRIASGEHLEVAVRALVDLVRLPSGTLQDDISIVLCRGA